MLSRQPSLERRDEHSCDATMYDRSTKAPLPHESRNLFVLNGTRSTSISGELPKAATTISTSQNSHESSQSPTINHEQHKAFRLLEDVKSFIPLVLRENELLKQNLIVLKAQAEGQIEAAEAKTQEWKYAADALKGQVDILESTVLDLRVKLQRAESILIVEKELSSKAGQEAAEAECLAKLFEDTVIQSFGIGTMFQDALARIEAT